MFFFYKSQVFSVCSGPAPNSEGLPAVHEPSHPAWLHPIRKDLGTMIITLMMVMILMITLMMVMILMINLMLVMISMVTMMIAAQFIHWSKLIIWYQKGVEVQFFNYRAMCINLGWWNTLFWDFQELISKVKRSTFLFDNRVMCIRPGWKKDNDQKESLILWRQGSFALLRCFS